MEINQVLNHLQHTNILPHEFFWRSPEKWGPCKDANIFCFLYRDRFIKTSVTKIICDTAPEIKVLSNHMDFRNMSVVFGMAVVISLALNGKW